MNGTAIAPFLLVFLERSLVNSSTPTKESPSSEAMTFSGGVYHINAGSLSTEARGVSELGPLSSDERVAMLALF